MKGADRENAGRSTNPWKWVLLAYALSIFAGCASTVRINVSSVQDTNKGRPFYMMVRAADERSLATEDYAEVAEKIFQDKADPSILKTAVIIPGGKDVPLSIDADQKDDLIVYFFFTETTDQRWYVMLKRPFPEEAFIELGDNAISRVLVR